VASGKWATGAPNNSLVMANSAVFVTNRIVPDAAAGADKQVAHVQKVIQGIFIR
jgi:hypothetical protein